MLRLRTKYTLCLLLIFICIISSACRTNSQSETAFERGINRDSITYDSKIIEEGYPREIKQLMSDGTEQTIRYTRAPHRIIAVWQNSIETLLALGVGKDIIAAIGVPDAEYISPEYREAIIKYLIKVCRCLIKKVFYIMNRLYLGMVFDLWQKCIREYCVLSR